MSLFNKSKSVETILGTLTGTVAELERHADDQLVKAHAQSEAARLAQFAHDEHKAEHALAKKVAGNIKALLGA